MSSDGNQQSRIMTLRVFDGQDDSMLEAIQNLSPGSREGVSFQYLQEYVSSLESKASGINLSPISHSKLNTEIELSNLSNDCKSTDLINIELSFIKIESLLLQHMGNSQSQMKNESRVSEDSNSGNGIGKMNNSFATGNVVVNNSEVMIEKNFNMSNVTSMECNNLRLEPKIPVSEKDNFLPIKDGSHILQVDHRSINNVKHNRPSHLTISTTKSDVKTDSFDMLNKEVKACSQCTMTFRYQRHLDRHLEGHQKNNCSHCNAKFARRKHLEVHLFRTHGERVTKYPHNCDMCSRSFPKRILLHRHRSKHNYENGKVCSECGEMLKSEVDDKEHKENHCSKKQFKCKRCLQTFSIEQTYLTHIQNHENYKCSECDITFASKKKVHEHYKMVHSSKLGDSKVVNNGAYFCADCRHTFFKKDDYSRHLESTSHLSKVSRDVPLRAVFACSICSKKLISQRALDQHIRRTHRGEKRFMCNIYGCTFQCARRTDLFRHKQLHIEQRNIVCEHCGKTFTSVSILNDHVLYVHSKERQFICEECGKAFKRNSLLKRHKLSHQQHRPFACMQCSTAFKRSHHLTRHMEACHRITFEKKKKVVKLMKTEDGHLVPVPEKPKKIKSKNVHLEKESNLILSSNERLHSRSDTDTSTECLNSSMELQSTYNTDNTSESPDLSLEFTNLLPAVDSTPQILSLVDINSGQVLTVEVTNPETLAMNDLIDQFEPNCNEISSLPGYQDLEFQNGILNTDQNFYDQPNYSELPLGSVEGTSLLLDSNTSKLDTLPAIENYLSQPFLSFLNL